MCILEVLIFTRILPKAKNSVYSDKPIEILSKKILPKNFRLTIFILLFIVLSTVVYLTTPTANPWYNIFAYYIFGLLIEPAIIYLNKDIKAQKKYSSVSQPLFTKRTKTIIAIIILLIIFFSW
jgi:hypothetical protein